MLVVEEVHHAGRPVAHGDEVRGCPVQAQQAQRGALLHAVHGVPNGRDAVHERARLSRACGGQQTADFLHNSVLRAETLMSCLVKMALYFCLCH